MRVLIAEDDRISRRMLQRQLEQWGHTVVAAADGLEAWNHFVRGEFSIVISDWVMPELNGLELIQRIRSLEGSYAYVILLTAKSDKSDLVLGMESGADDFLSKPFDKNELRVRLRAGERIIELERDLGERNQELQLANRRMTRELQAAAAVQQSLLPTSPPDIPGLNLAWKFRPCDELAGDFLNVVPLDDKHLALYVADVSGHGVVASLLSVTISRVLTAQPSVSSILVRGGTGSKPLRIATPSEVVRQLNNRFQMDDVGGMYFTIVYGILEIESLEFRYASAGHPSIVRIGTDESVDLFVGEGMAIGWEPEIEVEEHVVDLKPGDRLCLYSDGVPEAMNDALEPFGEDRFVHAWQQQRAASLADAVEALVHEVENWCGAPGPKDDVSILAFELVDESSFPNPLGK